jgi:hypothetical protein
LIIATIALALKPVATLSADVVAATPAAALNVAITPSHPAMLPSVHPVDCDLLDPDIFAILSNAALVKIQLASISVSAAATLVEQFTLTVVPPAVAFSANRVSASRDWACALTAFVQIFPLLSLTEVTDALALPSAIIAINAFPAVAAVTNAATSVHPGCELIVSVAASSGPIDTSAPDTVVLAPAAKTAVVPLVILSIVVTRFAPAAPAPNTVTCRPASPAMKDADDDVRVACPLVIAPSLTWRFSLIIPAYQLVGCAAAFARPHCSR